MWSQWICRVKPTEIWPLIVLAYRLERLIIQAGYSDQFRSKMWIYSVKHFEIASDEQWKLTLNGHEHKPEQNQSDNSDSEFVKQLHSLKDLNYSEMSDGYFVRCSCKGFVDIDHSKMGDLLVEMMMKNILDDDNRQYLLMLEENFSIWKRSFNLIYLFVHSYATSKFKYHLQTTPRDTKKVIWAFCSLITAIRALVAEP